MQTFVLLTTLPVLCIAAVASARHDAVQLYRALLASLQDHVAILDARGIVLEVNESWRRFAGSGDADRSSRVLTGGDYLAACRAAAQAGDVTAGRALAGVASVLNREQRRFEMEYELRTRWPARAVHPERRGTRAIGRRCSRRESQRDRAAAGADRDRRAAARAVAPGARERAGRALRSAGARAEASPWRRSSATRRRHAWLRRSRSTSRSSAPFCEDIIGRRPTRRAGDPSPPRVAQAR